jgi:hypothetical protein
MRDGLMHFEDWSRGMGRYGPQAERRDAGDLPRDIAREFWGFGFNPSTGIVSFGPYAIEIEAALKAAQELALRIYLAAREVDKRNTAELRSKTISALANSGMIVDRAPSLGFKVSPGDDLRVWISLDRKPGTDEGASGDLAVRIVNALASAGLRLVSNIDNDDRNSAARMIGGESLYVEADE